MQRNWLREAYSALVSTENIFAHLFLLLIRFYWGYLLFMIGLSKWSDMSETASFFASIDIPLPSFSAWLAGLIELTGGLCLFLGLFARVISLILIAFFLTAYGTAHPDVINTLFTNPSEFMQASPFLFLFTSLIVFSFGSGFLSFDYWIERSVYGRNL